MAIRQFRYFQANSRGKFVDKWQVPDYIFNGKIYPSFLNGAGYVMSRSTATCLYANGIKIPYIHLEVTVMILTVNER